MIRRVLIGLAALNGLAGVAGAAIGAHGTVSPSVATAATMQLIHALAALAALALLTGRAAAATAGLFILGALLFAGALYVGGLAGMSLGPAAPIGGVVMMLGWAALAWNGFRQSPGVSRAAAPPRQ